MSPPKNFIEFIDQPALDEIVEITANVVMKAELHELESCKHKFGTALFILGLKKDNKEYILQATELLDSLNSHFQAQAYTNIGIFCIDSERSVLREIGIQYLQRAFEAFPVFSILPALAEAGLSEQYAECKAVNLESILALSSDVIPMKLAYFANTLVKVEDEETILGYFQLIESRLPDPKESILRTIYESIHPGKVGLHPMWSRYGIDRVSVFNIYLELIKERHDCEGLKILQKTLNYARPYNIVDLHHRIVPAAVQICNTLYEFGNHEEAEELLKEMVQDILREFHKPEFSGPVFTPSHLSATREVLELGLRFENLEIIKPLGLILQEQFNDPDYFDLFFDKILLTKIGEYTEQNLRDDYIQFQQKMKTNEETSQSSINNPDLQKFLEFLSSTKNNLSKRISNEDSSANPLEDMIGETPVQTHSFDLILESINRQLTLYLGLATELGVEDLKNEIADILNESHPDNVAQTQIIQGEKKKKKKSIPSLEDKFQLEKSIIRSFQSGDIKETEKFLAKLEERTTQFISRIESDPPRPLVTGQHIPSYDQKETQRLVYQLNLAHVYLEINRISKVLPIIEKIHSYFLNQSPKLTWYLNVREEGIAPHGGYPPIDLLYSFLKLLSKFIIKKPKELDKWIHFVETIVGDRLPLFSLLLLKDGNVEAANIVLHRALNLKKYDLYLDKSYLRIKGEVFHKLGKKTEVRKILGHLGIDPHRYKDTWPVEREDRFEKLLSQGDFSKIQEEIDSELRNLHLESISKRILQDNPPEGVDEQIWTKTKEYLDKKLLDLHLSLHLSDKSSRGFDFGILWFLKELIAFKRFTEVKNIALSLLATLQKAIEELDSSDEMEELEFSTQAQHPFELSYFYDLFTHKGIHDFLFHYRMTSNKPEIHPGQLLSFYRKTKAFSKPSKLWLLNGFPYVYERLNVIFSSINEKALADLCLVNAKILHSMLIQQCLHEPITVLNFDDYRNLIDRIGLFHNQQKEEEWYKTDKNYLLYAYTMLKSIPEDYQGRLASKVLQIFRQLVSE